MIKKQEYMNLLVGLITTINQQKVSDSIKGDAEILLTDLKDFTLRVPLLGCFSAGKTSLINAILGRDVLMTDLAPETVLPCEIYASEDEYVEAVKKDGSIERVSIDTVKDLTPQNYTKIKLYTQADLLAKHPELILVDMPGVDSGLEAHNNAILSYMTEVCYFIGCCDVEQGMKQSLLSTLKEVGVFGYPGSVLVTKADQKIPEDVEAVCANVQRQAGTVLPNLEEVYSISAHDDVIDGFEKVFTSIDFNSFIVIAFKSRVFELCNRIIQELKIRSVYASLKKEEVMRKKAELEQLHERNREKFDITITKMRHSFSDDMAGSIVVKVGSDLVSQISHLASALLNGEEQLSRAVNDILRPSIMTHVKGASQLQFELVLKDLASLENKFDILNDLPEVLDMGKRIGDGISNGGKLLGKLGDSIDNKTIIDVLSKLSGKLATVGAFIQMIVTKLQPLLSVVLTLMPNILETMFSGGKEEDAKRSLHETIIPNICSQIRPLILDILMGVCNEQVKSLRNEFENSQADILNAIEKSVVDCKQNEKNDDMAPLLDSLINQLEIIR